MNLPVQVILLFQRSSRPFFSKSIRFYGGIYTALAPKPATFYQNKSRHSVLFAYIRPHSINAEKVNMLSTIALLPDSFIYISYDIESITINPVIDYHFSVVVVSYLPNKKLLPIVGLIDGI